MQAIVRQPNHRRRIDYVLVGCGMRIRTHTATSNPPSLPFDEPIDGVWASDHFGVPRGTSILNGSRFLGQQKLVIIRLDGARTTGGGDFCRSMVSWRSARTPNRRAGDMRHRTTHRELDARGHWVVPERRLSASLQGRSTRVSRASPSSGPSAGHPTQRCHVRGGRRAPLTVDLPDRPLTTA